MTIMDLVDKKKQVDFTARRIGETIEKANKEFERISALEKRTDKDGKEAINLARTSTNELIMDLNECQKQLQSYALLLDSVMRQTNIAWPPKCSTLDCPLPCPDPRSCRLTSPKDSCSSLPGFYKPLLFSFNPPSTC